MFILNPKLLNDGVNVKKMFLFYPLAIVIASFSLLYAQNINRKGSSDRDKMLSQFHKISSNTILEYVKELASNKYEGRLTGSSGYDAAADWAAALFKTWGLTPAGDNGSFLQKFPNPYTLVLDSGGLILNNPQTGGKIAYEYEKDFYPGATSDSGEITGEVVFAGYGITAPELNYDDYAGIDVKGKIVLLNPEIPASPDKDTETFMKWRPYSFHDYKMKNASSHGAAGVLYNYQIVNPNCVFIKNQIHIEVGSRVVSDLFAGTGKTFSELIKKIRTEKQPASFNTGKSVTMKCRSEFHPEGIGSNVIAKIEGTDPNLKDAPVIIGAHLDHLGMCDKLMPGANDNASGVAVLLAAAEALSKCGLKFKRPIIFLLFGAEEQGVKGSEFYIKNLNIPAGKIKAFLNLESVGRGDGIGAGSGKNYPELFKVIESANNEYVHRNLSASMNSNLARPRQDAAHFLWAHIPTISFGTYGAPPVDVPVYHTTYDRPEFLTPEIMEDLGRIVFLSVIDLASE